MKCLILGGTSGLGGHITSSLRDLEYTTLTVSRENRLDINHYACDLGDMNSSFETLQRIKNDHSLLDLIICVAGYAVPTKLEEQTSKILDEHFTRNLGYVDLAFDQFKESLSKSQRPIFATIGSQWSLKTGCYELMPYISAKHALRLFTQQKARLNPWLKISNYCVPTMDTPACKGVRKIFLEIDPKNKKMIFPKELARPIKISRSLVHHLLDSQTSRGIYSISKNGETQTIT